MRKRPGPRPPLESSRVVRSQRPESAENIGLQLRERAQVVSTAQLQAREPTPGYRRRPGQGKRRSAGHHAGAAAL